MDRQPMEVEELLKFGVVMSKFHTNPTVNALIVGLVVFGMAALVSLMEMITEPLQKGATKVLYTVGWPKTYIHTIEATELKDLYSGVVIENPGAPRNRVLLKAIRLYMTEMNITARHGSVLEMHEKKMAAKRDETREDNGGTKPPPEYTFQKLPPLTDGEDLQPTHVEVAPGVEFIHFEEDVPSVKGTKYTYEFRSRRHDGNLRIKEFVKKAFEWYKIHVKEKESEAKGIYLYLQHLSIGAGKSTNQPSVWKRFRLSNRKSFDAFFHPDKELLLRLIDNFLNKTDKFSKAGFPDKLGLLLYGPPGTGKTTLIKCLAKYTNRNIVNINLAKIKTNQELMEIMYSQRFSVLGEEDEVSLQHNQVIFVLEDIDAATNVVQKRDGLGSTGATMQMKQGEKEKEEEKDPEVGDILKFLISASSKKPESSDTLNLSGVLNALDGVVETPGRMVIMTTNYRGSLDPALIRPGRINREIKLDYIKKPQAAEMIQYYYDSPPSSELMGSFAEDRFTPAELEQFCSEHTTVSDLFRKLKVVLNVQPKRC